MEFRIDTSMTGEVQAADLRKTLEDSRDHWLKTQSEAAGLAAAAKLGPGPDGKADTAGAMAHGAKIQEAASALQNAHVKRAAELADTMQLGIDQACEQADHYVAKHPGRKLFVSAVISGHSNARHASGSPNRLSVQLDHTWTE